MLQHLSSHRNKTFLKLEEGTNIGFDDTVKEIYLQFQENKIKIDWKITTKILFKISHSLNNYSPLSRCFQFKIYPNESKYQSLLARSRLIISFKHANYDLYLLPKDENLKMASFIYSGKDHLNKFRNVK